MIGIADKSQEVRAFFQVSRDFARYLHFGVFDSIADIVDSSYMPVEQIREYFEKNPDLVPDDTYSAELYEDQTLYRATKVNNLTYDIEYDLVRGKNRGYMTVCIQFVHDSVEPITTVELKDLRLN